ncbi:MAG: hypothetical protein EAZ21_07580 [Betaproteobacteria bacterium]|nr:MAG: hypothetical protein EAZ21_07580 [Betaproteobacteria bacterium]
MCRGLSNEARATRELQLFCVAAIIGYIHGFGHRGALIEQVVSVEGTRAGNRPKAKISSLVQSAREAVTTQH